MSIVLGIDPGVSGGLAWVGSNLGPFLHKMPESRGELRELLLLQSTPRVDLVVIERQEPRPTYMKKRKGEECPTCERVLDRDLSHRALLKSSAILFGGYCALIATLEAMGFRIEDVRPIAWQTALGLPQGGGKKASKARAEQLFPGSKVTHWNADAMLLASYGQRLVNRTTPNDLRSEAQNAARQVPREGDLG